MKLIERWRLHPDGLTIVVLEGNINLREWYARMLHEAGHHVVETGDAQYCLEYCKDDAPDILLMNVDTSGMSAVELVKRLREDAPALPPEWTAVVVCTGYPLELIQKQFPDGYVTAFLYKDFEPEDIASKLMQALELSPRGLPVAL